ncbi:hypothetical protein CLV99_0237 [Sphingobacterium yanglingense]|uniref:Uncharacterized protein n=2 Tax=Sphingobacterium yanglingense TaxID=1437280 RepID=A0A4R6WQQ6_9SPHI|nr:hypothetical protein CLV99_0237 [Sphingobacterium yanglingense]
MKEIKASISKDLILLSFTIIRVAIYLSIVFLLDLSVYFYYGAAIIMLPTFYLHFKYQIADSTKKVLLSDKEIFLVLNGGEQINLIEAEVVFYHGHVKLTRSNIPFLINPDYYNIIFKMGDGREFSVSSLLDRKLKNYVNARIDNKRINYEYYMLY